MVKKLLVLALVASLGGCATLETGVTNFENFVTSPKTQATLAVLSKATVVFICDVSAVANVAGQIEVAAGAGQSLIGTNGKVLAASTTACSGLNGLVTGTTTVPAGTTVVSQ